MALVVIGTCATCGAQQLDNGMILVAPEQALKCQTHDFVSDDKGDMMYDAPQRRGGGAGGGMLQSMPSQNECSANDKLNDHLVKVEGKINQTQATIQTLDERHEHWRLVLQQDFERVVEAAQTRRDKLTADLDELVQHKQGLLTGQLEQYQTHYNECQDMLDSIFNRIQTVKRDKPREEGIMTDSRQTIAAFPRLDAIPIAVAAECQTQPMVATLDNFGAILESDLGRLPMVLIDEITQGRQQISYTVMDPEDAEEKQAVNFIPGLQVEVQATVFGERSLGWEVAWTNRVPCENVNGTMRIDSRTLPAGEKLYIRARTIIINGKEATDPLRISAWSDVAEMQRGRINNNLMSSNGSGRSIPQRPVVVEPSNGDSIDVPPAPPDKNIFVVCVDPSSNAKLPVRPAPPDYVTAIKGAALKKFKWDCSPEDIQLKIVSKESKDVVTDLSVEAYPNNVLADMWDRNTHLVHVFKSGGEERAISPGPDIPPMDEEIVWPKRLMVRIKERPAKDSPARPSPLRIEDRNLPGGWVGALQKRYCERFGLEQEGEMIFYFVDDEGNRVKDIRQDADFLYVQENRKKVYAVGEQA